MHLVHSHHDNGWYWERFSDWKTSQVFRTRDEAVVARREQELRWE